MTTAPLADSLPKTRRRQVAKAPRHEEEKPLKLSIYLTPAAARRLGVHCTMERMSQSAVVEELINEYLRRYVVQDRGRPGGGGDSPALEDRQDRAAG
jgi:hypothetical protein